MKYIKTGQKRSDARRKYKVMVDNTDYKYLNTFPWQANKENMTFTRINGRCVLMSRLIMNAPENLEVDHKDGNRLNNQRSNLRLATSSQNKMNRGARIDNTSGYKGVSWHKQRKKWTARIMAGTKYLHLGLFENILDAARSYNTAAKKYHREFAWLNNFN